MNDTIVNKQQSVMGSEIDENGYFVRQKNLFTEEFGGDKYPPESGRYLLVWSKICQWSNRASIAIDLLGLDKHIYVTIVEKDKNNKNLGWQLNNLDEELSEKLSIRFLDQAYKNSIPNLIGRGTVPAIIDLRTESVINNDFHNLTKYLSTNFRPLHDEGAPNIYPIKLRGEIDALNIWLFNNVNNALYMTTFCSSKEGYWDPYQVFYSGMEIINERLSKQRFLFGDYITDSDIQLFTTLSRLDIRYTVQLGHTQRRLIDYEFIWPYMRDLYEIKAFKDNTYFYDFANPPANTPTQHLVKDFNERFLNQINFDEIWSQKHNREQLSQDPLNKYYYGE